MTETVGKITYLESLSIAWLLFWRGALLIAGVGIVIALAVVVVMTIAPYDNKQRLAFMIATVSILVNLFYVYPLLIRMATRKQFKGFRLQLVHEE